MMVSPMLRLVDRLTRDSIVADVDGAVYVGCFSDDSVYKIYGEDVVDIIYNVGDQPATLHIYRR